MSCHHFAALPNPEVMLARTVVKPGATLGADNGYDVREFVAARREHKVTPHVARKNPGSAIDKLGVNAHVYRVGKFKSAVEPYIRADQSPEARAASEALYGGLFEQWRNAVQQSRPKAQVAALLANPAQIVQAAGGDVAADQQIQAGFVDGDLARLQHGDLGRVVVHAENVVAFFSKTSAGDEAYITGADDGEFHTLRRVQV